MVEIESKSTSPQSLSEWTQLLCEQEMPIFSNTAQNIYSSLDDEIKGAMELASIILQDPNLTTKLLKVSNSSYYNPSNQKMSTITRAIVILGSNVVRELTIACSFFESIISANNKQRANEEIGLAIHAAVQAKEIAIACNDPLPEEVFIAALLNNIGQIAFWCFGGKQCQYISELTQSGNCSAEEAEQKVLGFNLSELSKGLSKSWKLTGLIDDAINNNQSNPRIQSIQLGKEVTLAINEGIDSEAMQDCLTKLESITEENQTTIKSALLKNTDTAVNIARKFGAHDASNYIQADSIQPIESSASHDIIDQNQIQFNILQDITNHLSGLININHLFEMVVEGIHRGVGMDRTLFCLFNPSKKSLTEKLSLGWLKQSSRDNIILETCSYPTNLFHHALHSTAGIWANPENQAAFYTPHVLNTIGRTECFIIPLYNEEKPIGLIYADRSINKKPLTEEDFKAAKHFTQQATIGLALYKIKKTN